MRMRQYICHTDHNLWDVIVNGDLEEEPAPTRETSAPPALKTAKQLVAKRNQERVKSILLLAIPDEYLLKFHNEDINQKFLRSLPPSWNQIALIMRNKPDIDEIDIDDLYNNLRVYEDEMKRSSSSTSTSQNLAFLSSENTSSTNEVSTASGDFGVSTAGGISQIDEDDLEELDLRWQVAMLTVRCYNCHRKGHFARECRSGRNQGKRSYGDNGRSNAPTNESSSQALVAQDGLGGYDWSNNFKVEPVNYALMAISSLSSSSSSDNEVQKCSKQCLESFKTLQKNYDSEREKHSRARLEIQGYELALESLESRILVHENNELAWEESSKNLDELLNSQMSARDKTGLGYGTQLNEMSNYSETDSEISLSVFYGRSSNEENTSANDRFSKADAFHVVPPPITWYFLTPRADISFVGLDEYAIRKKIIESKTTDLNTKTSKTVGKINEANTQKPKTIYESVNKDKVIIEDWNSDDEDDVSEVQTVSPVKTNKSQTVKTKVDKIGVLTRTGLITPVKQNEKRAAHPVSIARPVCTARPRSYYIKPAFRPKDLKQDVKTFGVQNMTTAGTRAVVNTGKGKIDTDLKNQGGVGGLREITWIMCPKTGNPEIFLQDHAVVDSGCSSHMTGNKAYLSDYEDYNGGFVTFGSDPNGAPRKDDVYSLDLKNIVPSRGITCLYANATTDESKLWLRRLGHVNFKNINKLVKGHLVRGLPSKVFVNDHTCVACKKGKQHKASCKAKLVRIIRKPLDLLHMDLFGPIYVESINKKRCDNGTEFKNHAMKDFYAKKGIKREFSVARTLQKNGVAERKNRTLIEAARTMCPLIILNTLDSLGKFDGKSNEGYLLGYSTTSKAFRVYNKRTKRVEENLHIDFLEDQPNVAGTGPNWMYDLDFQTNSMNYIPVSVENQVNIDAVEDVAPAAHEKPSENSPKDNDVQDSEDVANKEGQHQMTEDEQATSTNKLSTVRSSVSTATTPYVCIASTPSGANAEDASDAFSNDGIFNGAYDDENVGAVADFNNIDDTINVSPIPTLRIHKDHPKDQILGDPKSAVQTRGKIQKSSLT
ncbi:putative ribonuclease H-like domain-containing protein [Tanacetum coccineum]|uniref:Ribonuclease H-like domain-containing protein n=1 Tax=Tanacetum coccineum TaxID=301880 RepID=A0ABQ5G722_9ASTR